MSRNDRDERHKYEGDVFYEAWRRGLNPDNAVECAEDCYYDDRTPEQCVDGYAARRRAKLEMQEHEQQYPDEQFPPEEFPGTPEERK